MGMRTSSVKTQVTATITATRAIRRTSVLRDTIAVSSFFFS
jgi:hypothetical protein